MSTVTWRIPYCLFLAWLLLCCAANAETITVSGSYPVDSATLRLEDAYGWAITYEDLPVAHESDLRDVTSQSRKDGKSASEPGVTQLLAPRFATLTFSFDRPNREPGTRAPAALARAAILDMLKSYSLSIGGVEVFTLTESDGLFHIIPIQRKGASGAWEKIVPLLDARVTISPGQRTGNALLDEICQSLASQAGVRVGLVAPTYINLLTTRTTQIASAPNETARSVLSRFFAELATPRPVSWHLAYLPSYGYSLGVHMVDASFNTAPPPRRP